VATEADGRDVLVTLSGLRLPVRTGGVPAGEPAVFFLRPERIALAPEGDAGAVLSGEISEAAFVGETMRYVVHAKSGETFTVKRLNLDAADRLKVGARVALRWSPDAAFTQRRQP